MAWQRVFYHGARLVLGGAFLWAGMLKASDVEVFAGQIAAYQLLPHAGNVLLAVTLPYVEILCGALLLGGRKVRPAALLAAGLLLIFAIALVSAWARGLAIDCGCFRPGAASSSIPLALLRDAVLLVLAGSVLRLWRAPQR